MLTTPRLTLTPVAPEHIDVLWAIFRDPHVRQYLLDDAVVEREWVEEEVRTSQARVAQGSLGLYLCTLQKSGDPVGFVGFRPFYESPVLQLLYGLLPGFTGQGLATEMAQAAVDLAFAAHGFAAVRASTDEPNRASVRVLERLGMTLIGAEDGPRFRQLHFELPRERWAARRSRP
jgi:ribosomal-protein-alanine N-acetyltransferase